MGFSYWFVTFIWLAKYQLFEQRVIRFLSTKNQKYREPKLLKIVDF